MPTRPEHFIAPEDAFSDLHGASRQGKGQDLTFSGWVSQVIQHGRVHLIDNCLGQMISHEPQTNNLKVCEGEAA